MHLGRKIKLARVAKGWSQQVLAEKINKTRPLISYIELTGKVSHYTLTRISKALGVSLEKLDGSFFSETELKYETSSEKNYKREIDRLKNEIELLKELVMSQKEIILSLKEKQKSKRKK